MFDRAPETDVVVDLCSDSLERSRRRRGVMPESVDPAPERNLLDLEIWSESTERSQLRRKLAEERGPLDAIPGGRKVAAGAAVAAVLATSTPVGGGGGLGAKPAAAAVRKALKKGDSGSSVKRLQRALGIGADGIFGAQTDRAVRDFQARHGLTVDGVVGPATWGALGHGTSSARASTNSSSRENGVTVHTQGGSVSQLQRLLGIAADGVFGPQTGEAVKRFQRSKGLTADGVVGPQTWAALGVPGKSTVLKQKGSGRKSTSASSARSNGSMPSAVARAIAAADRIATLPYRLGGGHGSFNDSAYDCSGTVSYVLHAIGKLGSPLDSSGLQYYGQSGPGKYITIYANPSHAFMTINGRRFDTTGRAQTGSRWQPEMRSTAGYVVRHPPGL